MTIPWWHPVLGDEEIAAVRDVITSGYPNDGAVTDEFGRRIAELVERAEGIAVCNGTAALMCALAACGVEPGDDVLVPDLTFIATANAVRGIGARVVLVDVSRDHFGLDVEAARAALTPRTKAIVAVHVNGRAGDLEALLALAREHELVVVEDAAEALGSRHVARPLGSFGRAATFSFAASKIITTGQGGAVVTDDPHVARRVRQFKDQGRAERGTGGADEHPVFGLNFKLTNVQAAIGLAQLAKLTERLAHLRALREWYEEELAGLEASVRLPDVDVENGEALCWIDAVAERRDALVEHLTARGIEPRPYWYPLHTQAPYADAPGRFPNAEWVSAHAIWLPSALSLDRDAVAAIGDAVREFAAVSSRA